MIDHAINELKNLTLKPKALALVVVGTEPVTNKLSSYTLVEVKDMDYEAGTMLAYELARLHTTLVTLDWEPPEEGEE